MTENKFRKRIRLEGYDYSTPGAYFVTICTLNRENILWDEVGADIVRLDSLPLSYAGKLVEKAVLQMPDYYNNISVDKYVIMPDHVHLLVTITGSDSRVVSAPTTLSKAVGSMKRWVSKQFGRSIWQKSFFEHSIRNQHDYDDVYTYIENNPLKYSLPD